MLSNMRIGMKLLVGFGLLILLLLAIGLVAFFSLQAISGNKDRMVTQTEIFSLSNTALTASYEAQLASAEHLRTQDPANHDRLVEQVKKIGEASDAAEVLMLSKENKANAEAFANEALELQGIDAQFNNIVDQYKKARADRNASGKVAIAASLDLAKRITDVVEEEATKYTMKAKGTNRHGDELEYTFIRDDRVKALLLNASVQRLFQECRSLARDYDAAQSADERKKHASDLDAKFAEMYKICDDVLASYTVSPECDEFVRKVKAGLEGWANLSKITFKNRDDLEANQVKQAEKAEQVNASIAKVVEGVQTNVDAAGTAMADLIGWVQIIIAAVGIMAVLLGMFAGVLVARNITTGIGAATSVMGRIAKDGDLTMEIPASDMNRRDEVGDLARAVQEIISEFRNVEQLAEKLAGGNWLATVKTRGELDVMNINLSKMLDQVNEALSSTADAVDQVATGASQVAAASESLSQGATESAASIEEITASMQEIGGQTNANAQNANEANKLAQGANESAAKGQDMMKKMIGSMDTITKNSTDIQKVVKVIDDISFQTNLLALNAAVEAARAGAHGKGFAVVAEEVRNLASRSAKAAAETTQMINTNSRQINEGAEIAQQTAEMLDGIVEQSTQVATILKEIANASNEQAQGVSQVSQGLHQIDAVTQQNTANAEETASVSHEMSSQAGQLQRLIGQFQIRKTGDSKGSYAPSSAPASKPATTMEIKLEDAHAAKPAAPKATAPKVPVAPKPAAAAAPTKPVTKSPSVAAKSGTTKPIAIDLSDAGTEIHGDGWGGGKPADVQIDLGDLNDKNFGKY